MAEPTLRSLAVEAVRKRYTPQIPADRFEKLRQRRRELGMDTWEREIRMVQEALADLEQRRRNAGQTQLHFMDVEEETSE